MHMYVQLEAVLIVIHELRTSVLYGLFQYSPMYTSAKV